MTLRKSFVFKPDNSLFHFIDSNLAIYSEYENRHRTINLDTLSVDSRKLIDIVKYGNNDLLIMTHTK